MSEAAEPPRGHDTPTEPLTPGAQPAKRGPIARAVDWITERSALMVVLSGFAVVLVAYGLSLIAFDDGSEVGTALAPITGVIGTIVGAYFGVQAGASGKADSEAARVQAEREAKALAAVAGPDAERILRETGTLPPRPDVGTAAAPKVPGR